MACSSFRVSESRLLPFVQLYTLGIEGRHVWFSGIAGDTVLDSRGFRGSVKGCPPENQPAEGTEAAESSLEGLALSGCWIT